jgi:hypothetical protein
MHIADAHREMLPDDVSLIPMPDSRNEAELLLLFIDCGLFPSVTYEAFDDGDETYRHHVKVARAP